MTDGHRRIPAEQLARIDGLLKDVDRAAEDLPEEERREHEEAEQSITAARRHAERHDGLFQVY